VTNGEDGVFATGADPKPGEDVANVLGGGAGGDEERLGDLPVGATGDEES
jgi:hypothetical protein